MELPSKKSAGWNVKNAITNPIILVYNSVANRSMKENKVNIWIGQKDLEHDQAFLEDAGNEFKQLPIADILEESAKVENYQPSRRDFLKYLGFSVSAATVAASCDIPVRRAMPYVVKPDSIVPGIANYYASSFVKGGDYCSVLVKTREGRPIKIEGNELSPVTQGGTSARAQAMVLDLYDTNRIKSCGKVEGGEVRPTSWSDLDQELIGALRPDSQVRILSNTILSPSLKAALSEFTQKYPNTKVVQYDPVSSAAILLANEEDFGRKVIPDFHFDKADVVVGINSDFLGTWISPVEYTKQYSQNRKIEDVHRAKMSRHYQVESYMSLTGSNADNRILIKPSELGAAIAHLHNAVATIAGAPKVYTPAINEKATNAINKVAQEIMANKGKSLIVSGSNRVGDQKIINKINALAESYGNTITFDRASMLRQGDESMVTELVREMQGGTVDVLFVLGSNPIFTLPKSLNFADAITQVPVRVSMNSHLDETTNLCHWSAPDHHVLESWGDAEPKSGFLSLIQPAIHPLFNTRHAGESFLRWAESTSFNANVEQPYMEYVKKQWQENIFSQQTSYALFQAFWDASLHDGIAEVAGAGEPEYGSPDISSIRVNDPTDNGLEISLYESVTIGGGQYANNPWLQEMPDPINRCAWGNYLAIPVSFDGWKEITGMNGLSDGDYANLVVGDQSIKVPVISQFGQMEGTVALAVGYGREMGGRCANGIGVNVQDLVQVKDGLFQYQVDGATLSGKVGEEDHFSCVQYHHTMGVKTEDRNGDEINADEAALATGSIPFFKKTRRGYQGALTDRTIIRGSHLNDIESYVEELHHEREHHQHLNDQGLYPDYSDQYERGHHWGIHVDLNACTGCGACTVACMAENNVPVVGKLDLSRHQEMAWLRIDRYFYGDFENPKTVYQPMMCQHCDNAPCENVCPVNATNHSSEGLNQMIYNRCVGTRYCANNCPYKVRRLNWADYMAADLWPANERKVNQEKVNIYADNLTRMVLNPDVTVRARGVMEKCSFCTQRLQEGKLAAKLEGRPLKDSDVSSACQMACPAGAITFGDQNNKGGDLAAKLKSPLNYIVLEETNVRSSVQYSSIINNANEELNS